MGTLLKGLQQVRWQDLGAARGTARDLPALLSKAAWADGETARLAIDEIGDLICEFGSVVHEATAPAIPFLIELAAAPRVTCKAEALDLLLDIFNGRQWSVAAAGAPAKYSRNYVEQVGWEDDAQQAVRSGRPVFEELARSVDPGVAQAATTLLHAIASEAERRDPR